MNVIDILKDLIKIKSYSGGERAVRDYIIDFAKTHRLNFEIQDQNVLITFLNGHDSCMILNGHMDTVSSGDESEWTHSPFDPVEKEGKVYGLGASDMKSGIAAFLHVASTLKVDKLKTDLIFAFVVNEEVDGSGTQSFVEYFQNKYASKYKSVEVLFGEPTDLKACEIGHRGNYFIKLITKGDSGHGSRPGEIKEHAILKMTQIISEMNQIDEEVKNKYTHELLGSPSFSLTGISSDSDSPNKFSGTCSTTWDIRTTPQLHYSLLQELKSKLPDFVKIEVISSSPYAYTAPESSLVKKLTEIVPDLEVTIAKGASDMSFFTPLGIPAVCFGPGAKKTIHRVDEWVEVGTVNLYCNTLHTVLL